MDGQLLLIIVGPTGAGKSTLALAAAAQFGGEIVNCDSLQLYRDFNIGTAKIPLPERRGIPHWLLDLLAPEELFSAGDYARAARPVLKEISQRGRLPIVVGGTGFYLRALLHGLFAGPARNESLRDRLRDRGRRRPGSLARLLRRFDPAAAQTIHENDHHKLIRALEVCLQARAPLTQLHAAGSEPLTGFRWLTLGLDPPRAALYARLNQRCEDMFAHGLLDEVRAIVARGHSLDAKPFEAIGYAQARAVLRGELSIPDAIAAAQQATRRYAKRQWTWFRRDPSSIWLQGFGDDEHMRQKLAELVRQFL